MSDSNDRRRIRRRPRPPSDEHVDVASRVLAEMILGSRSPRNQKPTTPVRNRKPSEPLEKMVKVEVKEEARESIVHREYVELSPSPSPEPVVSKPSVALSLVDFSYVLSLVFGGCCSNVYTYEYLLKLDPHLGTTLTFSQMLFVTLHSLPSFLVWHRITSSPIPISIPTLRLKPRQVPLSQWALQVLVLTTGALLNNWAFGFSVPLTVQIVFRSAGLAVSMLFGRLFLSKRYSYSQIASVLLVTLGVILATTSRPSPKSTSTHTDLSQYSLGVLMLSVSLLMTGILGILQERAYTTYGPCWKEGIFYTHALSLPIFILFVPSVQRGFNSLNVASSIIPDHDISTQPLLRFLLLVKHAFGFRGNIEFNPRPYTTLIFNMITQLICVSGVNQMTSRISSVSTNIVLTTRKAISLLFSVWWFGNGWNAQLGSGAGMVFLGSILYTAVTSRSSASLKAQAPSDKDKPNGNASSPLGTRRALAGEGRPGRVPREAKRLERENVVKIEPKREESPELTNRKWKGKGRMY